jgi:hypothetical protein
MTSSLKCCLFVLSADVRFFRQDLSLGPSVLDLERWELLDRFSVKPLLIIFLAGLLTLAATSKSSITYGLAGADSGSAEQGSSAGGWDERSGYVSGVSILDLPGPWGNWSHYHSYAEIVDTLLYLNSTYPDVVDVFSIGKSWQDRDIYCIRLTNDSSAFLKSQLLLVGYHHAREPISLELPLYFAVKTAADFGVNATTTYMLDHSEIYIVVALNVDGLDLFAVNDYQRKNARPTNEDGGALIDEDPPEDEDGDGFIEQLIDYTNPSSPFFVRWEGQDNDGDGQYGEDWVGGVDLNRNYDYQWQSGSSVPRSEVYKGPAPFSEPETQAIRDLAMQHDFSYAISFHSGTELILYPWGYTYLPPPDEARFIEVAQQLSAITGGTTYEQSSDLYTSYGLWEDWMYGVQNVSAFTCEIFGNNSFPGVIHPGPYPNSQWEGGLKYWFNPFPNGIEEVILRWLPVFYNITNRAINEAPPIEEHDVVVTSVEQQKTMVGQGYSMQIGVEVANRGLTGETFNVTAQAGSMLIGEQTISLSSGSGASLMFDWGTSGWAKGNYSLCVSAEPVLGETVTENNNSTARWVFVSIPGDTTEPYRLVDIFDVVAITGIYESELGDPEYQANSDIDGNGIIDIFDVVACTSRYEETW